MIVDNITRVVFTTADGILWEDEGPGLYTKATFPGIQLRPAKSVWFLNPDTIITEDDIFEVKCPDISSYNLYRYTTAGVEYSTVNNPLTVAPDYTVELTVPGGLYPNVTKVTAIAPDPGQPSHICNCDVDGSRKTYVFNSGFVVGNQYSVTFKYLGNWENRLGSQVQIRIPRDTSLTDPPGPYGASTIVYARGQPDGRLITKDVFNTGPFKINETQFMPNQNGLSYFNRLIPYHIHVIDEAANAIQRRPDGTVEEDKVYNPQRWNYRAFKTGEDSVFKTKNFVGQPASYKSSRGILTGIGFEFCLRYDFNPDDAVSDDFDPRLFLPLNVSAKIDDSYIQTRSVSVRDTELYHHTPSISGTWAGIYNHVVHVENVSSGVLRYGQGAMGTISSYTLEIPTYDISETTAEPPFGVSYLRRVTGTENVASTPDSAVIPDADTPLTSVYLNKAFCASGFVPLYHRFNDSLEILVSSPDVSGAANQKASFYRLYIPALFEETSVHTSV